jgi:hypothetical protein
MTHITNQMKDNFNANLKININFIPKY